MTIFPNYQKLLPVIIFILTMTFHLLTFDQYPGVAPDDGLTASRAKAVLTSGDTYGSLEQGLIREVPGADKRNYNLLTNYIYAGPSFLTGAVSLTSIRSVNLILIGVCLFLVYLIAVRIQDWKFGTLAILIVGLSTAFSYSSHLARPDLLAGVTGLFAIYLFLNNNQRYWWLDLLIGILLIIGFDFHPRIVIFIPIIGCLYLERYRLKSLTSKNCYAFLTGIVLAGATYYWFCLAPYSEQARLLSIAIIAGSRTPPLLSLDYQQFIISFRDLLGLLSIENYLSLGIFACLITSFFFKQNSNSKLITLSLSILFFIPGIFANIILHNSVIFLPLLGICSAYACYQILFTPLPKKLYLLTLRYLLIAGVTVLLAEYAVYRPYIVLKNLQNQDCQIVSSNFNKYLHRVITPSNSIIGEESFWFEFQDQTYHSWKNINYLMRLKKITMEEALQILKPDFLILDQGLRGFINATPSKSKWVNNMELDAAEFQKFLDQYATPAIVYPNKCTSTYVLYKLKF